MFYGSQLTRHQAIEESESSNSDGKLTKLPSDRPATGLPQNRNNRGPRLRSANSAHENNMPSLMLFQPLLLQPPEGNGLHNGRRMRAISNDDFLLVDRHSELPAPILNNQALINHQSRARQNSLMILQSEQPIEPENRQRAIINAVSIRRGDTVSPNEILVSDRQVLVSAFEEQKD